MTPDREPYGLNADGVCAVCGTDFFAQAACMNRAHEAVGCYECGACLHESHTEGR